MFGSNLSEHCARRVHHNLFDLAALSTHCTAANGETVQFFVNSTRASNVIEYNKSNGVTVTVDEQILWSQETEACVWQ